MYIHFWLVILLELWAILSIAVGPGPVSKLITRSWYAVLNTWHSWDDMIPLSSETLDEFGIICNLQEYESQPLWYQPGAVQVVYSDVSDTGFGGYTVEHGHYIAHGHWDPIDTQQSFTWRELCAMRLVFQPKLHNYRVKWFTMIPTSSKWAVRLQPYKRKPC